MNERSADSYWIEMSAVGDRATSGVLQVDGLAVARYCRPASVGSAVLAYLLPPGTVGADYLTQVESRRGPFIDVAVAKQQLEALCQVSAAAS